MSPKDTNTQIYFKNFSCYINNVVYHVNDRMKLIIPEKYKIVNASLIDTIVLITTITENEIMLKVLQGQELNNEISITREEFIDFIIEGIDKRDYEAMPEGDVYFYPPIKL